MTPEELKAEADKLIENLTEYKLDESLEVEYLQSKIEVLKFALAQNKADFEKLWSTREEDYQKKIDANLASHQSLTRCIDEIKIFAKENKEMKELCGKYQDILAEAQFEVQKRDLILEDLGYDMDKLKGDDNAVSEENK